MKVLEPEVLRRWIQDGVPSLFELQQDFGLDGEFNFLDRPNAMRAFETFNSMFATRDRVLSQVTHAIPCREAIDACLRYGPLVEVGAGTGFWASLIAAAGGSIIATDVIEHPEIGYPMPYGAFHEVLRLEAIEAVERHPDRNVLCIWPCLSRIWSAEVVRRMKPRQAFLLVGEGSGGCVGHPEMFDCLARDFELAEVVRIPRWPTIRDVMTIHVKKESAV